MSRAACRQPKWNGDDDVCEFRLIHDCQMQLVSTTCKFASVPATDAVVVVVVVGI